MTEAAGQQDDTEIEEIDVIRISELIPHRYPFLMIDRMRAIKPDHSAVGIKNVTVNESYFAGHFPSRPVMPGVLIIEAMAQTAASLVAITQGHGAGEKMVYFMTIDNARFRKPVVPGDQLEVVVKKVHHRGQVWKFSGKAYVDGASVADAVFSAMLMDN